MRALMVGGGCRGLALAGDLVAEGHAVRAVTRREAGRAAIEAAGCECWIGDPDVVGTLRYALDNVTVLLWLLGPVDAAPLQESRLEMMLERTIDTTARGIVHEAAGPHGERGAALVRRMAAFNEIPHAFVAVPRDDEEEWVGAVHQAIAAVLTATRA
jgi:hypothetical protein